MKTSDLAKKYFPFLWSEKKIRKLVQLGKLTESEYEEITGMTYPGN